MDINTIKGNLLTILSGLGTYGFWADIDIEVVLKNFGLVITIIAGIAAIIVNIQNFYKNRREKRKFERENQNYDDEIKY